MPETRADAAREVPVQVKFCHHRLLQGPTSMTLQRRSAALPGIIRLWSRDSKPVSIARIESSTPEVVASCSVSEPMVNHEIRLKLVPSEDAKVAKSLIRATVLVFLDEKKSEPYRIDVMVLP